MIAPHPTSCSSALKNCKRERSQHREKRSGTKRERETHTHTCTDLVQELLVPPSQALVLRCPLLAGGGHAVVSTEGGVELTLHAGVNLRRDGVAIEQVVLLLNLEGSRHVLKHHAVAVEGAGLGVPDFGLQSGGHSFVDHRLVLPLLRLLELVLEGRALLLELGDLTRPPLGLLKPLLDSRDGPLRPPDLLRHAALGPAAAVDAMAGSGRRGVANFDPRQVQRREGPHGLLCFRLWVGPRPHPLLLLKVQVGGVADFVGGDLGRHFESSVARVLQTRPRVWERGQSKGSRWSPSCGLRAHVGMV